uniref:Uncharacterized protein n=1 Tax=Melopsittacus undulatus TaxID=13146 RepID=A0A8V5HEV4_MELUD
FSSNWAAVKCFICGQEDHIKKDCPHQNGRGKGSRGGAQIRASTQLCPQCQKGYHWGNRCQSKMDKSAHHSSECRVGFGHKPMYHSHRPECIFDTHRSVQAIAYGSVCFAKL